MSKTEHMGFCMIRRPLLPLSTFKQWQLSEDPDKFVVEQFDDALLSEALYLATTSLHQRQKLAATGNAALDDSARKSMVLGLSKYLSRAAFRSTPFGLFAFVQAALVGEETTKRPEVLRRNVSLDGASEARLIDNLASMPQSREAFRWIFNSTYVRMGETDRATYIQIIKTDSGKRKFIAAEVEHDWTLELINKFCQSPRARGELENYLGDAHSASEQERREYIDTLIEEGLLLPFIGGVTSERCSIHVLDEWLSATPAGSLTASARRLLEEIRSGTLDENGHVAAYQKLAQVIDTSVDRTHSTTCPVQVDAHAVAQGQLSHDVATRFAKACEQLQRLAPRRNILLRRFVQQFEARFDRACVPLTLALDQDWGIPYPEKTRLPSPLLEGLIARDSQPPAAYPRFDNRAFATELIQRAQAAMTVGDAVIKFTSEELESFMPPPPASAAPISGWAHGYVSDPGTGEPPTLLLIGTGGTNGMEMMSRFGHALPEMTAQMRETLRATEQANPDVIYAEVIHCAQDRLLNVSRRPALSDWEIVISGTSELPRERQIWLEDLGLELRDGKFQLIHLPTARPVQPRLTSAHNYISSQLGLYQFMAAMANMNNINRNFEWPLATSSWRRLPRVEFDSVIVQRAQWRLGPSDLAALRTASAAGTVSQWRMERGMPRFVTYDMYDNMLPIDFELAHSVSVAADELEGQTDVRFHEAFALNDAEAGDSWARHEAFEVVLPLKFDEGVPVPPAAPSVRPELPAWDLGMRVRGAFEQWVYAKIYVGAPHADLVLEEYVMPVMKRARASGALSNWFFIRFTDSTGEHLRLRFLATDRTAMSHVQGLLTDSLAHGRHTLRVSKVAYEDYAPEFERYGGVAGMAVCEELFMLDSEDACALIRLESEQDAPSPRWLAALAAIDTYSAIQQFADCSRSELLRKTRDAFVAEQLPRASARFQLGARFRNMREEMDALTRGAGPHVAKLASWRRHLEEGAAKRTAIFARLAAALSTFDRNYRLSVLASLLHMQINRLIVEEPRGHEAILYDFLVRIDEARASIARRRDLHSGAEA